MGLSIWYNYGFSSIPGSGTAQDPYVLTNPNVSSLDNFLVSFIVDNGPPPGVSVQGTIYWSFTGSAYTYRDLNVDPPVFQVGTLSLANIHWSSGENYDSNSPTPIPTEIDWYGSLLPFKDGSCIAYSPGYSSQPDNFSIAFQKTGSTDYGVTNGSLWSNFTGLVWFVSDSTTAAALQMDTQPSGVVSGTSFTTQPIVKIVDSNGNVVPDATNLVTATITISNGTGGTLSGTTSVNAVNGYATFTDLAFTGDASFYLVFESDALTAVYSNQLATLTAIYVNIDTQPVAGISGNQLSVQPVCKITNWLDQVVTDYSGDVVCSLTSVTGSATLTGTDTIPVSSGYANYSDLVVTGSGSFYLTFSSGTLYSVNSEIIFFLPDAGNPNPPIPVKPKRSYIPGLVPTFSDMEINELAINVADKKGYVRDSNNVIHKVFDGSQGVSSIIAGAGISVNNSVGDVTISTVASAPSLEQLTDVQITNKLDGQILKFYAPGQKWVNSNTLDGGNF